MRCDQCGLKLGVEYYESHCGVILCDVCGNDLLVFCDDLDCFILEEDYKQVYLDDDISDIDNFEKRVNNE